MTEKAPISPPAAEQTWLPGPWLADFPDKTAKLIDHGNDGIVVINFGGTITAFRNRCLHQDMPLHAGYLTPDGLLLCPWHNWCYAATTGACLTVPGAELERFPVQVAEGRVWVRIKHGNGADDAQAG